MSDLLLPVLDPQLRLYDQLLLYPLFLGMSRADLLQLVGNTRFDFRKYERGKTVVQGGTPCTHLYFLMQGKVSVQSSSDDYRYRVVEVLSAPWIIEPENLFGLTTNYTKTVKAFTDCHFILLTKDEVVRLQETFLTFRLNYLNLLSTLAQQRSRRFWRRTPSSLEDRIICFFTDHCVYPAGAKEFYILMTQLADILNDSRLDVSRALNEMQRKGVLELHRGRVLIPSLEHLFM